MAIDELITHYGVAAIFLGAGIEGEAAALAGGIVAHRELIPVWQVAFAIYAGTLIFAQILFHTARRFRAAPWVGRQLARPACARVMTAIERRPVGYLLIYRFVPGARALTPVVLGNSHVSTAKFTIVNLVAAAIWAAVFTALGYGSGQAVQRLFARLPSAPHLAMMVAASAAVLVAGYTVYRRWKRLTAASAPVCD